MIHIVLLLVLFFLQTSDINLSFLFSDAYWVLAFECYTDITYPDVAYNIRCRIIELLIYQKIEKKVKSFIK